VPAADHAAQHDLAGPDEEIGGPCRHEEIACGRTPLDAGTGVQLNDGRCQARSASTPKHMPPEAAASSWRGHEKISCRRHGEYAKFPGQCPMCAPTPATSTWLPLREHRV
jgi:hypothetical protein